MKQVLQTGKLFLASTGRPRLFSPAMCWIHQSCGGFYLLWQQSDRLAITGHEGPKREVVASWKLGLRAKGSRSVGTTQEVQWTIVQNYLQHLLLKTEDPHNSQLLEVLGNDTLVPTNCHPNTLFHTLWIQSLALRVRATMVRHQQRVLLLNQDIWRYWKQR